MAKTYRAGVLLGARSDTDDADGTVTSVAVDRPPDRAAVEQELRAFLGAIEQVPPAFSAAKVIGRRAYDLARQGEEVSLEARRVHVHGIDVLAYDYPRLGLEVRCGKGTYIRSLARDLGERLGCGGLIASLRRTRVGPFEADGALGLDADAATARARLLPVSAALADLPRATVPADAAVRLRSGQGVPLPPSVPDGAEEAAVFDAAGGLVAVARIDCGRRLLLPAKVLTE
jgi:tRNA pseudouridine55 synthase